MWTIITAPLLLLLLQLLIGSAVGLHNNFPAPNSRRQLLLYQIMSPVACLILMPSYAEADEAMPLVADGDQRIVFQKKPTAPVGALIPAVQQRLLLQAAIDYSTNSNNKEKLKLMLPPLDDDNPFMLRNKKDRDVKILQQYNAAYVLKGDMTRAAMNLYTTNLNYNQILTNPESAFTVTDPDWKKSYIRANDGLPTLTRVIGADLELRYLYRNAVQETLDDAAAELYADDCDGAELKRLLQDAAVTYDAWLDRIRLEDVRDAMSSAAVKGEKARVCESFAAGFIPPTQQQ